MYNSHRGMVPTTNSRLTELLDQVRTEFESQTARNGEYEHKSTCSASWHSFRDSVNCRIYYPGQSGVHDS